MTELAEVRRRIRRDTRRAEELEQAVTRARATAAARATAGSVDPRAESGRLEGHGRGVEGRSHDAQ